MTYQVGFRAQAFGVGFGASILESQMKNEMGIGVSMEILCLGF